MYNLLLVIGLSPKLEGDARAEVDAEIQAAFADLPETLSTLIQPTLPGVYNGGDLLCRAVFPNASAYKRAVDGAAGVRLRALLNNRDRVTSLDEVAYHGGLAGGASRNPHIYRVALFSANVAPTPDRLGEFRTQTASIPAYVNSIQRWQLSTVDTASGLRPWTHVWEQEYADLDGLNGTYMLHPVHWAHVERWFDPEYPEHLVDPVLVHSFCAIDAPVIRAPLIKETI